MGTNKIKGFKCPSIANTCFKTSFEEVIIHLPLFLIRRTTFNFELPFNKISLRFLLSFSNMITAKHLSNFGIVVLEQIHVVFIFVWLLEKYLIVGTTCKSCVVICQPCLFIFIVFLVCQACICVKNMAPKTTSSLNDKVGLGQDSMSNFHPLFSLGMHTLCEPNINIVLFQSIANSLRIQEVFPCSFHELHLTSKWSFQHLFEDMMLPGLLVGKNHCMALFDSPRAHGRLGYLWAFEKWVHDAFDPFQCLENCVVSGGVDLMLNPSRTLYQQ